MSTQLENADDGKRLRRNTLWNLFGIGLPLIVAIFSIPSLIDQLGIERFGILTMVWAIIGYFGIFDLGLARALTRSIASMTNTPGSSEISKYFWTAVSLMVILGISAGVMLFVFNETIVTILNLSPQLNEEVQSIVAIISFAIPLFIVTNAFKGMLEAKQRFDIINWVRFSSNILTYLIPLLLLSTTKNLVHMVVALVVFRVFFIIIQAIMAIKLVPEVMNSLSFSKSAARELINFGGWVTVSNILNPIMMYVDRFTLAAISGMTAVTYYSASLDLSTKISIIPSSLSNAIFPAISSTWGIHTERANRLFLYGLRYNTLFMFPLILLLILFSYWGMSLWLGEDFAEESYKILQILGIGVFLNGMATLPYAFIHGMGKANLTARVHLVECVLYIPILFFLIQQYGAIGAAIAWTLRVGLDCIILFCIVGYKNFNKNLEYRKNLLQIGCMLISALLVLLFPTKLVLAIGYLLICLLLHILVVWRPYSLSKVVEDNVS